MRRFIVPAALGLVAIVTAVVLLSGSGESHELDATFLSAPNLVSGARVISGGVPVGTVDGVALRDGLADVRLRITDDRSWPLPRGTKAEIRWGGTVSYSNRYVQLLPGPAGNPALADGARLPTTDTVTPVEFDQLFNVFNASGRRGLATVVDNGSSTLGGRAPALRSGIEATAPALDQIDGVLRALGEDPNALRTLVATGAQTAQAVRSRQAELVDLVNGAATTFRTIATNSSSTQATLAKLPGGLDTARQLLTRLDPTLTKLQGLVHDIRPGAAELHRLVTPLSSAITTLHTVAPDLDATLATVQHHGSAISELLDSARPVLSKLTPALEQSSPIAACVRPYTPEIASFVSTWLSMASFHDANSYYARVFAQAFPFPNEQRLRSSQLVHTIPNLGYSLIRPPGYGAGGNQTWLQPQCGAGAGGLDPTQDPEAGK
jgi:phospholipid/cholesterol/gamma-HCH transport system substrate-binding protein